jgi:hypothetical protein
VTSLALADDEGRRDASAGRWPRRRADGEPLILRRAYLCGYNDEYGRMRRLAACPQLELFPAPGVPRTGNDLHSCPRTAT